MKFFHGICEKCGTKYEFVPESLVKRHYKNQYIFITCKRKFGYDRFYVPKICFGFVELEPYDEPQEEKDTSK